MDRKLKSYNSLQRGTLLVVRDLETNFYFIKPPFFFNFCIAADSIFKLRFVAVFLYFTGNHCFCQQFFFSDPDFPNQWVSCTNDPQSFQFYGEVQESSEMAYTREEGSNGAVAETDDFSEGALCNHNRLRAAGGLSPLTWDQCLGRTILYHHFYFKITLDPATWHSKWWAHYLQTKLAQNKWVRTDVVNS